MEKIIYPKVYIKDILTIFWKSIRRRQGLLFTLVASISIVNVVEIITPLYYKRFFDTVIAAGDKAAVAEVLTGIIVIILGLNGIIWLGYRIGSFVENRFLTVVSALLRQQAFDWLLGHSYS